MEIDLRVKFREIEEKDDADLHLVEDYPLTEAEQQELRDALLATIRASTYFIDWGHGDRSFMAGVSHVNVRL